MITAWLIFIWNEYSPKFLFLREKKNGENKLGKIFKETNDFRVLNILLDD